MVFDFASLSFQVPMFGSSAARQNAPAARQRIKDIPIVFVFMSVIPLVRYAAVNAVLPVISDFVATALCRRKHTRRQFNATDHATRQYADRAASLQYSSPVT